MKPSVIGKNNLFRLIHSLTMSEKRYFKVSFNTQGQDKNYQTLFDLINKQTEYDEEAIKAKLKGAPLLNNFHVAKKYLFDAIMKSLVNYNANRSVDFKIHNLIQQVIILNKKGLTDMSKILVDKAQTMASDYERYHIFPVLSHLRAINLTDRSFRGYTEEDLDTFLELEKEVLDKLQNIHTYRSQFLRISSNHIKHQRVWNEQNLDMYKAVVNDPHFSDESKATTLQSRLILFNVLFIYYGEIGESKKALEYKKKYIKELAGNPKMMNERVDMYISSINNLLVGLLEEFEVEEVPNYLNKVKNAKARNEKDETLQFRAYYLNLTEYYSRLGQFNKTVALAPELDTLIEQHKATLDIRPKEILIYQLALANFVIGDYGNAINRLLKIINQDDEDLNSDILAYSKVLLIMSHFELGNFDIVEYLLRSTKRFFIKNDRTYPFEVNLMEFFTQFLKKRKDKAAQKELYLALKEKMDEALKNPLQKKILEYFDITSWIASKLTERPFMTVIQEKVDRLLKGVAA